MVAQTVPMKHVVEVGQFDRPWVEQFFTDVDTMRLLPRSAAPLAGYTLATIFYEPSTRTRLSFETAMYKLGGNVISTENAREFSSAIKGETVEDTVRIVGGYADGIVIRHYEQGAAHRAAAVSECTDPQCRRRSRRAPDPGSARSVHHPARDGPDRWVACGVGRRPALRAHRALTGTTAETDLRNGVGVRLTAAGADGR